MLLGTEFLDIYGIAIDYTTKIVLIASYYDAKLPFTCIRNFILITRKLVLFKNKITILVYYILAVEVDFVDLVDDWDYLLEGCFYSVVSTYVTAKILKVVMIYNTTS